MSDLPPFKPHKKQHQAMQHLLDKQTRYVLFGGGARGGKSWLGWIWILGMCAKAPGTKWFVGREELKRLRETTLQTFWKILNYYGIPQKPFYYNAQDYYIIYNDCRIDFLELKRKPQDPQFQRFGSSEYTGGWIEEAGEIHHDAFDVLKGRIGQHLNDKYDIPATMYLTCNPARNWLYREFYKPWKAGTLSNEKAFIPSLVTDNPYREKGSEQQLKDMESDVLRKRLYHGDWEYEDDPEQLIKYEWVEAAEDVVPQPGTQKLGVDVARFGDDKNVVMHLDGTHLHDFDVWGGTDTTRSAQRIRDEWIDEYSVTAGNVGVDVVGLGAGVVDTLRSFGYDVTGIHSGSSPIEDSESAYEFYNLRSQMWWWLRQALKNGDLCINVDSQRLIEDLTAPRYEISAERVVRVEAKDKIKERIGRSPDYADALVYAYSVTQLEQDISVLV